MRVLGSRFQASNFLSLPLTRTLNGKSHACFSGSDESTCDKLCQTLTAAFGLMSYLNPE